MCFAIDNASMLDWLRHQVRVIEGWREVLAMQPDMDIATLESVERHYQWLTGEVCRLEDVRPASVHLQIV